MPRMRSFVSMKCPHCGKTITAGTLAKSLGARKSERKAKSSAANGALGGRPRTKRSAPGAPQEQK